MSDHSIARDAARLRFAVFASIFIIILLYVLARFGIGGLHLAAHPEAGASPFAGAVGDVAILLLNLALFRLSQMLEAISRGAFFSKDVTRRFRAFAFWLLVMTLFRTFSLLGLAAAAGMDGKDHYYLLPIDLRELTMLGLALILFLIARLLERAREIEAEMREIV